MHAVCSYAIAISYYVYVVAVVKATPARTLETVEHVPQCLYLTL